MLFEDIKPDDRVYRRVWDHEAGRLTDHVLTVIRVNRKTITARTEWGVKVRVSLADVIGAR